MGLNEQWKPIPGYESYSASSNGRIRRNRGPDSKGYIWKEHYLSQQMNRFGYMSVALCKNGKVHRMFVHRAVMLAFVGECPNGYQVNHIDENKINNRIENLEYVTPKENANHGTHIERIAAKLRKGGVYQYTKDGELVNVFKSIRDVNESTGYDASNVAKVCRGKMKSAYGFIWKYGNDVQGDADGE